MNPLTVVLSGLLLASAVVGGLAYTDSSQEYNRYPSGSKYKNFNQRAAYGSFPSTFDAREQWAQCPSVGDVPNQGCCDSSYALIPTAVMTDRTCIGTNSFNFSYSAFDPISCCADCAIYPKDACRGGDPVAVWNYWTKIGITKDECLPYAYANTCIVQECPLRCAPGASGTVALNKKKGLEYYTVPSLEQQIQAEIYSNGPVEASFDMYLDFATFQGEKVYIHRTGPYLNKHSVKIIGWGTCENTPYWLVVNTFGKGWGDNGVAKFLRGQNHLTIETNVHAAKPNL